MGSRQLDIDPCAMRLKDFEAVLCACEEAAQEGDLAVYRELDEQLRNMALAMIGGMPGMSPTDSRYASALKEAVTRLGRTAKTIDQDRLNLKARQRSDRRVRLAYGHGMGRA